MDRFDGHAVRSSLSLVELVDSRLFIEQVFGLFTVDSLAQLKRLDDVVHQLLLFMVFLPLFDAIVLAVDLVKVAVHLLVLLKRNDFFIFDFFLLFSLREVVFHGDLAGNRRGTFFAAIVAIHERNEAY